jgi:hypothetical protein
MTEPWTSFAYTVRCAALIRIIDLDEPGSMSVTNNAENVLRDIASDGWDLDQHVIIYRDTAGEWDALLTSEGCFAGFSCIANLPPEQRELVRLHGEID